MTTLYKRLNSKKTANKFTATVLPVVKLALNQLMSYSNERSDVDYEHPKNDCQGLLICYM